MIPLMTIPLPALAMDRFVWDTMHPGVALLFATRISPGDAGRQAAMRQILDTWVDGTNGITKTPKVGAAARGSLVSSRLPKRFACGAPRLIYQSLRPPLWMAPHPTQGLSFADKWGPLRLSANMAFVALAYSQSLPAGSAEQLRYSCWAISQMRSAPRG
jgi:hypothetical protein